MPEDKCDICSAPAGHKCSACKQVSYCSKVHQKQDWKKHRSACRSFEVSVSLMGKWSALFFMHLQIQSVKLIIVFYILRLVVLYHFIISF
jgi:hypothetical protein